MKRLWIAIALLGLASPALAADDPIAEGHLEAAFTTFCQQPSASGAWKIVREGDGYALELADDFEAKKGPDVKFFLSPTAAAEVTGANATAGSTFVVQLERFSGAQRFPLPAGAEPEAFRSLVLHCEAYSKLWAISPLR